ncbi:hypothetical protein AOXY_G15134 [Acipenser oxyrinchus oxyrinchus]|uniref:Uncharacterized protein n=1 Tax=Acipenser oxyrinchus oxyrinchus TaxID=40147 RepID=A0AAD8D712_ACIOX|nr:hypothetical protein AOXY_G15134 [Acipenser oxyrinchus oxyrinchus]
MRCVCVSEVLSPSLPVRCVCVSEVLSPSLPVRCVCVSEVLSPSLPVQCVCVSALLSQSLPAQGSSSRRSPQPLGSLFHSDSLADCRTPLNKLCTGERSALSIYIPKVKHQVWPHAYFLGTIHPLS